MMFALALGLHFYFSLLGIADLIRMQGKWQMTVATDGVPAEKIPKGMVVEIKGNQIISLAKDKSLHGVLVESDDKYSMNRFFLDHKLMPKTVYFACYIGIYDVTNTRIRFCLKYAGQGVEGEAASQWKAPTDFIVKPGQQHMLITFESINLK